MLQDFAKLKAGRIIYFASTLNNCVRKCRVIDFKKRRDNPLYLDSLLVLDIDFDYKFERFVSPDSGFFYTKKEALSFLDSCRCGLDYVESERLG